MDYYTNLDNTSGNLNNKTPILFKIIKGFPGCASSALSRLSIFVQSPGVGGHGGEEGEETHAYSETFTKGYISFHLGVREVPPCDISSGWLYCTVSYNLM